MKKLFYSSAYNIRHSEINEENVLDKLKDDIRSKMLGDVKKFVYSERAPLAINPRLFYVGGFYYEKEDPNLTPCENVVKMELDEIEEADVIMASLLKYSSIATITEILYAAQFPEKEIIIFCNPEITQFDITSEYWFPILTAKHMNDKSQIKYVKDEDEILDFIKNYGCSTKRVIIEGADGVGKTTVVQKLREFGLNCLDREKTTISSCMFPEIPVAKRATIWDNYLNEHSKDILVILTMKDQGGLIRRIRDRGGVIDDYDRKAPMYDGLYRKTYKYMRGNKNGPFFPTFWRMALIDVSYLSIDEVVLAICESAPIPTIIVASNNVGKIRELRQLFPEHLLLGLKDAGIEREVVEDGNTFLDNARKKATEICRCWRGHRPVAVIADDSGLAIDSLNGFPGVLTHRFLGENATDEERNAELIHRASGEAARFICELVYFDGSEFVTGHGEIVGRIASSPRGENGFGFDPIFELPDGRTLAELSSEEKNAISARHLAAVDLALKLR